MTSVFQKTFSILNKVRNNVILLKHDSEKFGRNLMQLSNPELFESRLIDVMHAHPMHVRVDLRSNMPVRLNVLDSSWTKSGMTGGPNTVINLALRIASKGISVRLVSTAEESRIDAAWLRNHAASLLGQNDPPEILIESAANHEKPLDIGKRDLFLATHWTTAHQLMPILPQLPIKQFFYMLQEFEPGFYPWSSNYARSLETFNMDFYPIINERFLAEFLFSQPFGRLPDPATRERAIIFEPAVDRNVFHPISNNAPRQKRILFYARPTNTRNMFGIGILALREIAADPTFRDWEFVAIGGRGSVPEMKLGHGHVLRPAPWVDYIGYAKLLQNSDLLLCPMISPHTSYPVLEMVACGGISITNVFLTKTESLLHSISPNIIAVEPTVDCFVQGLRSGAKRAIEQNSRIDNLLMATNWNESLQNAVDKFCSIISLMV